MIPSGTFYHGTSSHRLDSIRQKGFRLRDNWSKWLCARGVYFVLNRPLVALYYARRTALLDRSQYAHSEAVVIEVPIHIKDDRRVLNLTTDDGMQTFVLKYQDLQERMGTVQDPLLMKLNEKKISSIRDALGYTEEEKNDVIAGIINQSRAGASYLKWDCAVLTDLVAEHGFAAIMAAFQEGVPGAYDCFRHEYRDEFTQSYQGIRYRDSIILCITDLDWIERSYTVVDYSEFDSTYIEKVCSIKNDPK